MLAVSLKIDVKAGQAVLLCWFRLKHLIYTAFYRYIHDPTRALINLALYLLSLVLSINMKFWFNLATRTAKRSTD